MTEIAQLFELALRHNQAKAAMNTVAAMPPSTTLRQLLQSDAGDAIRTLTLRELRAALLGAGLGPRSPAKSVVSAAEPSPSDDWGESREEQIYRRILEAMADEPVTIGQLAKRTELEPDELRGYLDWMKKMGKVTQSGRARATRYQAVR